MKDMKLPKPPSLARKVQTKNPKVEIVIACEGMNTEPQYFQDCIKEYGAGMVRLRILDVNGAPMTIVAAAIEERKRLLAISRRSRERLDSIFRVWAVFDEDEHPNVGRAIEMAQQNSIDVAFSSPCFELWPLLHLQDYGALHGRHYVQALLEERMPNYSHAHRAIIDFPQIRSFFDDAFRRALQLLESRRAEGIPYGRPCSSVGQLVKKIVENGKSAFRL